nr:MAG TPA: hypothetical protein [Caudoviricetes sp.]
MVKVRQSQIHEESGKAVKVKNTTQRKENVSDDELLNDVFFEVDNKKDDEDLDIVRTMLHIPELGFSISLFGIETIDKSFRVYESINGTGDVKPQYGIILNKDMEKSMRYPRTNVEFWFDNEKVRDKRYDKIISRLKDVGYRFIEA